MSGEKKISGHQDEMALAKSLVEARPDLSSFDMSASDLEFRPVMKGDPLAGLLEEDLKAHGFDQILNRWHEGMLWDHGPFIRLGDRKRVTS